MRNARRTSPLAVCASRSIRLADLLIEVANDLRFSAHFLRPGGKQPEADEACVLLAATLAHGCNLGLHIG